MQPRSHRVLEARPLDDYVIRVGFDNGVTKDYDLKEWQLGRSRMFQDMDEERF